MKITKVDKEQNEEWFSQLNVGDTFMMIEGEDDCVYIKLEFNHSAVAVNLETGRPKDFSADKLVTPVECELKYWEKYKGE